MFLVYGGEKELVINGYIDASFDTDPDDSKSQPGYVFILIFIALWAVITHNVTILMPILSYFTRFT